MREISTSLVEQVSTSLNDWLLNFWHSQIRSYFHSFFVCFCQKIFWIQQMRNWNWKLCLKNEQYRIIAMNETTKFLQELMFVNMLLDFLVFFCHHLSNFVQFQFPLLYAKVKAHTLPPSTLEVGKAHARTHIHISLIICPNLYINNPERAQVIFFTFNSNFFSFSQFHAVVPFLYLQKISEIL